ncbi:glycine cleavage system H protein-like [Clavelina lepadiformis]|uniref:glycine cleavage system H protein-like n=1 Tax=Clavelina lepadiformis TaxID=159417 RepID=UPI004041D593
MSQSLILKSARDATRVFSKIVQKTLPISKNKLPPIPHLPHNVLRSCGFHNSAPNYSKFLFTDSHEWIKIDGDVGTIGITNYAQEQLGDIVFCELPEVATEFSKGDIFATVESVKAASDLYIPISGEVVEVNEKLVDTPAIINESPTEDGWLVMVKLTSSADDELSELLTQTDYEKTLN